MGDELANVGGAAGGLALALFIARYLWDSVRARKETLEASAEVAVATKLDTLVAGQQRLELDMRGLKEQSLGLGGALEALRVRVDKGLENHSGRIGEWEEKGARVDERLKAVEGKLDALMKRGRR